MRKWIALAGAAPISACMLLSYPQGAWAQGPPCMPPAQQTPQATGTRGRGPAPARAPRNLTITAIPGVVAASGQWTKVWQAEGNSADGIIPDKDGNVLVAQEDFDTARTAPRGQDPPSRTAQRLATPLVSWRRNARQSPTSGPTARS